MNNINLGWLEALVQRLPETRPARQIAEALLAAENAHSRSGGILRLSETGWKVQLSRSVYQTLVNDALWEADRYASGPGDPTGGPSTGPFLKFPTARFPEYSFMGFPIELSLDLPPNQWQLISRRPPNVQPNGHEVHSYVVAARGEITQ